MPLVRLLPERWQKLLHEALKFGVVGGINTVINYAVFNALALTVLADGQLKATVIATVVATFTSYLMNRHWTYRDRPKSALRREYALFFLFNATGLVIELGVLGLAKYGLGMHSLLALNIVKTIALAIGTVFRFWAYRTFVFRSAPVATASSPLGDAPATNLDPVAVAPEPEAVAPDPVASEPVASEPVASDPDAPDPDAAVTELAAAPVGRGNR